MPVSPIPEGYPILSASLCVADAKAAIAFYTDVLGGTERMRFEAPDGKIGHAEIQFGDSVLMLADEYPDMGFVSPRRLGGTAVNISLFVEDADAVFSAALAAGATEVRPVEDQFYGDRSGMFEDPFGHRWGVATHIEDMSEEEMMRRGREEMGG